MAKKFYIASQTPFAEVVVKSAKDVEGKEQEIKIGFKRYGLDEGAKLLEEFKNFSGDLQQESQRLKQEILYIKNAELVIFDDEKPGVPEKLVVQDTRTAQPFESFWGTKEECLSVLVDHFLDSGPWKGSIITAFVHTLYNSEIKEAERKN